MASNDIQWFPLSGETDRERGLRYSIYTLKSQKRKKEQTQTPTTFRLLSIPVVKDRFIWLFKSIPLVYVAVCGGCFTIPPSR
jgi:hypothetical protein